MNELISVIVPVYNVEKYLTRCINSILGQSYNNIEIILVDDGSTDRSGEICDSFIPMDNRIRVYHKANGGLSSARNFGMSQSTGDLFAFIDSDDYIHKDFFSILMKAKEETNADIISSDMYLFADEKEILIDNIAIKNFKVLRGTEIINEYFVPREKRMYIYHGLCMKIYNRNLFTDLKFEEGRLHEDLFITYKLLNKSKIFCFVEVPYYYYFQGNSESICKNFGKENFVDKYDAFEEMKNSFALDAGIRSNLTHFLFSQYFDLIYQGRKIEDKDIQDYISNIKKWMGKNLKYDTNIGWIKKILVYIMIRNTRLYEVIFRK